MLNKTQLKGYFDTTLKTSTNHLNRNMKWLQEDKNTLVSKSSTSTKVLRNATLQKRKYQCIQINFSMKIGIMSREELHKISKWLSPPIIYERHVTTFYGMDFHQVTSHLTIGHSAILECLKYLLEIYAHAKHVVIEVTAKNRVGQ
jgi:hypothetical protein